MSQMSGFKKWGNVWAFIKHMKDPEVFRERYEAEGDEFEVFGGTAHCPFHSNKELMSGKLEKVDYFAAPNKGNDDYYSENFMLFQPDGPDHERRRELLGGLVTAAHGRMDLLEETLASNSDLEMGLVKFLFDAFIDLKVDDAVAADVISYRKLAGPLSLLSYWLRRTVFISQHRKLLRIKGEMVERIAATGHAIPDNVFDMIWFNSISLAFYPEKAFEAMAADQELRAAVVAELDLPSKDRLKSRALIMEMTRLHPRIASINYADEKGIQVAMIPTGNVDPERYSNPRAIDLERDHSDSLTFARPSHRACLAYDFAPDVMAAILAQMVRAENGN